MSDEAFFRSCPGCQGLGTIEIPLEELVTHDDALTRACDECGGTGWKDHLPELIDSLTSIAKTLEKIEAKL